MQQVEICVKGRIDERWLEWLGDVTITYSDRGETLLTGSVVDQSALYGLVAKLRDLGLPLVSVNPVEMTDPGESGRSPPQPISLPRSRLCRTPGLCKTQGSGLARWARGPVRRWVARRPVNLNRGFAKAVHSAYNGAVSWDLQSEVRSEEYTDRRAKAYSAVCRTR